MKYKFRGKRKDNGQWVYGSLRYLPVIDLKDGIHNPTEMKCLIQSHQYTWNNKEECYKFEVYEVIPETAGQWTGLKDKDGVDIYGGDVCKLINHSNVIFEVFFDTGCWSANPLRDELPVGVGDEMYNYYGECEVVGNVTDHREILEH